MTMQEASCRRLTINLNLDRLNNLVLGVLIGLCLGAVGMSLFFHFRTALPELAAWLDSVLQNTGTEMFGTFLTVYLIEVMLRKRREQYAEKRTIEQEKQRLTLQIGSPDRGFAVEAARILRARGWGFRDDTTLHEAYMRDANLQGAYLLDANLEGANLQGANLERANLAATNLCWAYLWKANLQQAHIVDANLKKAMLVAVNLQGACLWKANLQEADLKRAEMQGASLIGTNMKGVNLWRTNLQEVDLRSANLQGADLVEANLQGASLWLANLQGARYLTVEQLRQAETLEGATLPDGTTLPGRTWHEVHNNNLPEPPWREAFEAWCETVETDEKGYIKVADEDDNEDG